MAWAKPKMIQRPPHYLRRRPDWQNWESITWSYDSPVVSWQDAEKWVADRNKTGIFRYKLPLHCERCYATVNETYPLPGHADMLGKHGCLKCHMEGLENMKQVKKDSVSSFTTNVIASSERKQGDIWKLPTVNSPMWTAQWGYQGSGKVPYIVSHKAKEPFLGNVTTEGWACSCPAFTRNTPRIPCKHCLGVMKKEGIASVWLNTATKVAVAEMGDADAQAFAQWKREQAAAKKECDAATAGGPKLKLAINTGRKFR